MADYELTIDNAFLNVFGKDGDFYINGEQAVIGSILRTDDVMTCVAKSGFKIKDYLNDTSLPQWGIKNRSGVWEYGEWIDKPKSAKFTTPLLSRKNGSTTVSMGFEIDESSEPEPLYTFDQTQIDFLNDNKVIAFMTIRDDDGFSVDEPVIVGTKIYDGDAVYYKPFDGYRFNTKPSNKLSIGYSSPMGGYSWFTAIDFYKAVNNVSAVYNKASIVELFDENAPVEPEYLYQYDQTQIDFLTSENVIAHVSYRDDDGFSVDEPIVVGTKIFSGYDVYYVAGDGYEFDLIGSNKASIGYRSNSGGVVNLNFDFENPNIARRKAELSYSKVTFVDLIEIYDDVDTKGVNDVFLISDDTMRGVINANFNAFDGQENTDYGQYILGLLDLPFAIDSKFVKFTDIEIKLAGFATGFNGDLLKSDVLKVNMGDISVTGDKDNFLDYSNTLAMLHLPYTEPVNVDIDYVIDHTISIEYLINLYDGMATINISSSKLGGVIATLSVDMSVSVPFGSVTSQPSKNDPQNVSLGGYNGIDTPYIEILRNDAILENGFFTSPIVDESVLLNQIGFIKVDEIELKTTATNSEKSVIKSLLTNGVILK